MADFCSYSSYVRDTRDEAVSRRALTSFASMTRHRIVNDSGMLYQFAGDSVVGLFGVPEAPPGYLEQAVECARGLVDIGASVATEWQRQIDQVQPAAGVHVSMALGDLQVLSLRPLSRTHMGVIGDCINLAARLNTVSGCDEIVVSNTFYQRLPDTLRAEFQELPPVEAKNIGRIRAWKLGPRDAPRRGLTPRTDIEPRSGHAGRCARLAGGGILESRIRNQGIKENIMPSEHDKIDSQKVIGSLNTILELELAGVVRYLHYSLMVFGHARIPIIGWMRSQATEGMNHAAMAGEHVTSLGGHPSLNIGKLVESHKHDITQILGEALDHERATLREYYNLLGLVVDKSVWLEEYAREQITLEEQHIAEVDKMMRKPGELHPTG